MHSTIQGCIAALFLNSGCSVPPSTEAAEPQRPSADVAIKSPAQIRPPIPPQQSGKRRPLRSTPVQRRDHERRVVRVTNESELRRAIASRRNITIQIAGSIDLRLPLKTSAPNASIEVEGVTKDAALRCRWSWRGWGRFAGGLHGITFNNRNVTLRHFTFSGYDYAGSAIRFHCTGDVVVDGVAVRDCATGRHPIRPGAHPSKLLTSDVAYGQGISGRARSMSVLNCVFERVATNAWKWSHCIYAQGIQDRLVVSNCEFKRSGNPVTYRDVPNVWIVGNLISDLARCRRFGRQDDYPYLVAHSAGCKVQFLGNKISGPVRNVFNGPGDSLKTLASHANDERDMKLLDSYAILRGRGGRDLRTREDWKRWSLRFGTVEPHPIKSGR